MPEQLRAAEVRQAAVGRDVLLDILFDDLRQFLEQRLLRKRGHVHVIGGEYSLQVGDLSDDPGAERAERNLDFAEQLGNQTIDFASCQRIWFSRRGLRYRWP